MIKTALSAISKDATEKLYSNIKTWLSGKYDEFLPHVINVTEKYVSDRYKKLSKAKTILYRNEPVDLDSMYVDLDLMENRHYFRDEEYGSIHTENLCEFADKWDKIQIIGTAGAGKSTLCKAIFRKLVHSQDYGVPFFIELRNFRGDTRDLLDFVLSEVRKGSPEYKSEYIHSLAKWGKVFIILDGLDEVDEDKYDIVVKHIVEFSEMYRNARILVSSRPDDSIHSWTEFKSLFVAPLSKDQSIDLVSKIKYDIVLKEKFMEALDDRLYSSHESFASNPLLLTMMLMTYEQYAEIPSKIHIFYQQAFETLHSRHDSTKEVYKRKMKTNVPLDDFINLTSAFCLFTYSEEAFRFTKSSAISWINKSIDATGIKVDKEDFFSDLGQSVCLLIYDGLEYTFTHRSFQEYFTALFICNYPTSNRDLLDSVTKSRRSDSVFHLAYSINERLIDSVYVIPVVREFVEHCRAVDESGLSKSSYLSYFWEGIELRNSKHGPSFSIHPTQHWENIYQVHPKLWRWPKIKEISWDHMMGAVEEDIIFISLSSISGEQEKILKKINLEGFSMDIRKGMEGFLKSKELALRRSNKAISSVIGIKGS